MNLNCSTGSFIHSLIHYEAEETVSSSVYLNYILLVLTFYEGRVFSELSIQILNGCILTFILTFPTISRPQTV